MKSYIWVDVDGDVNCCYHKSRLETGIFWQFFTLCSVMQFAQFAILTIIFLSLNTSVQFCTVSIFSLLLFFWKCITKLLVLWLDGKNNVKLEVLNGCLLKIECKDKEEFAWKLPNLWKRSNWITGYGDVDFWYLIDRYCWG